MKPFAFILLSLWYTALYSQDTTKTMGGKIGYGVSYGYTGNNLEHQYGNAIELGLDFETPKKWLHQAGLLYNERNYFYTSEIQNKVTTKRYISYLFLTYYAGKIIPINTSQNIRFIPGFGLWTGLRIKFANSYLDKNDTWQSGDPSGYSPVSPSLAFLPSIDFTIECQIKKKVRLGVSHESSLNLFPGDSKVNYRPDAEYLVSSSSNFLFVTEVYIKLPLH